ncbi:MAG: ribosome silencing factor [bacterium]
MMTPKELAGAIAGILEEKFGEDIVTVDLSGQTALADYFVIVTAGSSIHARALGEAVVAEMKAAGERVNHVEGLEHGNWVLLDYVDVVVHIFSGEARQYYGLERLWGDLPSVSHRPAGQSARE